MLKYGVDSRVLRELEHTVRRDAELFMKRLMQAELNWCRTGGTPQIGWVDGVKQALVRRVICVEEAKKLEMDRREWRIIVNPDAPSPPRRLVDKRDGRMWGWTQKPWRSSGKPVKAVEPSETQILDITPDYNAMCVSERDECEVRHVVGHPLSGGFGLSAVSVSVSVPLECIRNTNLTIEQVRICLAASLSRSARVTSEHHQVRPQPLVSAQSLLVYLSSISSGANLVGHYHSWSSMAGPVPGKERWKKCPHKHNKWELLLWKDVYIEGIVVSSRIVYEMLVTISNGMDFLNICFSCTKWILIWIQVAPFLSFIWCIPSFILQ